MPYLIVEYDFSPPITDEALAEMATTLGPCTETRGIRKLRTVISEDRRRGFCEFEAADAETVREAFRSARVAFRSVWPAHLFDYRPPSAGPSGIQATSQSAPSAIDSDDKTR